jgi:replication factor C subunit 2/4
LDSTSTFTRLSQIATAEHILLDPSVISTLISTSSGDLRRSITYLQSASRLSASTNPPTPITALDIQEIAGVVPDGIVVDFARALGVDSAGEAMDVDDGLKKVKGFERIKKKVKELIREGYSASQILSQVS